MKFSFNFLFTSTKLFFLPRLDNLYFNFSNIALKKFKKVNTSHMPILTAIQGLLNI